MVLYKGISNIDDNLLNIGYKSVFKNFNSTSHSLNIAKNFRRRNPHIPNEKKAIIEYHVNKNVMGMPIMSRARTSTESEMLLKFGQRFEVISVEQMEDGTWYIICNVYR